MTFKSYIKAAVPAVLFAASMLTYPFEDAYAARYHSRQEAAHSHPQYVAHKKQAKPSKPAAHHAKKPAQNRTANPLKGSKQAMRHKEQVADKYDLTYLEDGAMVDRFAKNGYLVPLRDCRTYYYATDSPDRYALVRPYTRKFLENLSREYYAQFHKQLKVTSAVRPKSYQHSLRHRNGNAARASPHATGAVIDVSKRGMSRREIRWMRQKLATYERLGYIDATEEFRQPTFDVMVFPTYTSQFAPSHRVPQTTPAPQRPNSRSKLARK